MNVTVHYSAQARLAAGVETESVALTSPALADLVRELVLRHGPELGRVLLDAQGRPHPTVLVLVDDEPANVNAPGPLADGQTVTILPPIAGG